MLLIHIVSKIKIKLAQDLVATLLNSCTAMSVSFWWLLVCRNVRIFQIWPHFFHFLAVILPHNTTKIINHLGKLKPKGEVSVCLPVCYPLRAMSVTCTSTYLSTYSRIAINSQLRIILMFQAGRKHEIPGGILFFP